MRSLWKNLGMAGLVAVAALTITACSDSGTSSAPVVKQTTVSGTAAAGAPIIGSVTIKDSATPTAQTKTVDIAADGKYVVDVAGMTAPFMVRADGYVGGNEYHLYSAGTSADVGGTINVTPLTDMIMDNIAGTVAKTYFDNGSFTGLTAAELTAQSEALKARLLPILQALGVSSSIDLLRASFNTDHTGIDAALDVLRVTTDPATGVATITNIINQQQMTCDPATGTYVGMMDNTTGLAAGATDIQAITAEFDRFSTLFASSLPAATSAQLLAMFDQAGFMHDGRNLAGFLGDITTDPSTIGIKFNNVSITALNPDAGTGEVSFDVIMQGRSQVEKNNSFKMVKRNNVWLMQGNQRIAKADIFAWASYSPGISIGQIRTGLNLNIQDRGGKGVATATVKGPGLPGAGVTLINDVASNLFSIQQTPFNPGNSVFTIDDTTIGTIPGTGATYTIELRDAANVLMATYTDTLRKRPYKLSELTVSSFPAITAPTLTAWRAFTGGDLTVTWTLPAGLMSDFMFAFLSGAGGSARAEVEVSPLAPTRTTATITIQPQTSNGTSFTITNRNLEVGVIDSFGRELTTNLF